MKIKRAYIVLTAAIVLLIFLAAFGRLGLGETALYCLILFLILILARRTGATDTSSLDLAGHEGEEDQVMRAMSDAMAAPCFILDWRGNIIHRNLAASGIVPRAEVGTPIFFAIRHPAFQETIEVARQTRLPETTEFQQIGGGKQWYRAAVAPFQVGTSPNLRNLLLVVMENQTEQRRTETMRVDFIANASHELRTPLTSVIGFIDTLLGPAAKDEAARERFLTIMRAQAERMSNLIEDLMSLSRIELRQHLKPSGRAELGKILDEVVEGLQAQIAEADVTVTVDKKVDEASVPGDHDELFQVFQNVVDNAIKYGASGKKIEVTLKPARLGSTEGFEVAVIDYGPGVAAEHVPRMTERFYRVDAETSRKKKGTGLGLAIVKHIVQRHRGELTIKSELGLGTRVAVFLPK
ncbi:MAG: hypothetical protein H6873_05200 [Hyphomicrobiaceae bacterium]|nr:hypothetical protein [Hyphomicrobiaceae bacterium]